MTPWTPSADATLRALYPTHTRHQIAEILGRSEASVANRVQRLGLKKDSNAGRFQPGMTTWNKGLHYVAGGRSAETRFKPGTLNGRARVLVKPVGSERISKDGYLERKINNDLPFQRRWRAVHLLIWEQAHGPLPRGYAVVFKDGNKQHITLDNLALISRKDLMKRNSVHNHGPEIAKAYQLKGAITRQINRRKPA
jgi:hypothetical protein